MYPTKDRTNEQIEEEYLVSTIAQNQAEEELLRKGKLTANHTIFENWLLDCDRDNFEMEITNNQLIEMVLNDCIPVEIFLWAVQNRSVTILEFQNTTT